MIKIQLDEYIGEPIIQNKNQIKESNQSELFLPLHMKMDVITFLNYNMEKIFNVSAKDTTNEKLEYVAHYLQIIGQFNIELELDFQPLISDSEYNRLINRMKFYISIEMSKHMCQIPFVMNISIFNAIDLNRAYCKAVEKIRKIKFLPEQMSKDIEYVSIDYTLNDSHFCVIQELNVVYKNKLEGDDQYYLKEVRNLIEAKLKDTLQIEIRNNYMNKRTKTTGIVFPVNQIMKYWNESNKEAIS